MEQDILSEVIETEKELQRCLEEERTKARKWLEAKMQEAAEEQGRSERELQADLDRALAEAETEAQVRAAAIAEEAQRVGERLLRIEDATLQGLVERKIGRILPG